MSDGVLISIRPRYVELIAKGRKTVEIRKNAPKLTPPFKCYIYETTGQTNTPWIDEDGHVVFKGRGAVVGEFVCDEIARISISDDGYLFYHRNADSTYWRPCITVDEFRDYVSPKKSAYAWHITNVRMYGMSREVGSFRNLCPNDGFCWACLRSTFDLNDGLINCANYVRRAPQNSQYVEE